MKKLIFLIAPLILFLAGFYYITRPVSAPTPAMQESQSSAAAGTFRIDPSESEAEFNIGEILRGEPFQVVGKTSDITGDIKVDINNPSASEIGVIRINARTLKTDSPKRDGAMGRMILKSEDPAYEFIEFKPAKLIGLPAVLTSGDETAFKIIGDLTVKGVTHQVIFDTQAIFTPDTIQGSATSKIRYKDFDLTIPNLPFIANVDEEVILKFRFTAKAL